MDRLAGYLAFCWLALAFITLGGTSSGEAAAVIVLGLVLTGVGAALRRVSMRNRRP